MSQITHFNNILGLDVGDKRIGVARVNTIARIPVGVTTIENDNDVIQNLEKIIQDESIDLIVIGKPRNMKGETTDQTKKIKEFVKQLSVFNLPIEYQDESLTSVEAEAILGKSNKPFSKADIDQQSAVIILRDYTEQHFR